jgi:hypothetical protein
MSNWNGSSDFAAEERRRAAASHGWGRAGRTTATAEYPETADDSAVRELIAQSDPAIAVEGWRVLPPDRTATRVDGVDRHGASAPAQCIRDQVFSQSLIDACAVSLQAVASVALMLSGARIGDHVAPDPECTCGYRIVPDFERLQVYFARRFPRDTPFLAARVRSYGAVCTRIVLGDPPGTVRVQGFVVRELRPVHLPLRTVRELVKHYPTLAVG